MKLQTSLNLISVLISAKTAQAFSCAAGTGTPFCCNKVLVGNVLDQDVLEYLSSGTTLSADIINLADVGLRCSYFTPSRSFFNTVVDMEH